jgi:hypothetical protein
MQRVPLQYGKDLVDDMSGEWAVGGDFKRILCALAKKHPSRIAEVGGLNPNT